MAPTPKPERKRMVLAALICAALLLPIWMVPYPPLLDYPNHLARSFVLSHLNDPAFKFRSFYRADWGPYPYLGMDLTLIALQQFCSAAVAGKIFLSLCVIGVPLSVWWLVRQANPGHDGLALWGLVLAYNIFFLEGFGNFQMGLGFCFATVGSWLRYLQSPRAGRWLAAAALATATYFVHLVAFALAGFMVLGYTAAARRRLRDLVLAGALFATGGVLYLLSGMGRYKDAELLFRGWPEKLFDAVAALRHGYSPGLETVMLWALVACVGLAWVGNPEFRIQWPWVAVSGGLLVLYCVLPNEVGESWDIDVRVIPALFATLLLVAQVGRRQRIVGAVALAVFALRTGDVSWNFVGQQKSLAAMAAVVRTIPRHARVLPLIDEHPGDDPLRRLPNHFWAYAILERGAVAPYLFDLKGQTALRITEEAYIPDRPIKEPLDWKAVQDDYDYVWVYDYPNLDASLEGVGSKVQAAGRLRLYRLARARVSTASPAPRRAHETAPPAQ